MTMERAEEPREPRRRGRKPAGPAEIERWAKRVERWKDSGLTAKDFANEIGVLPRQLMDWKFKLRKAAGEVTPRGPRVKRAPVVQLVRPAAAGEVTARGPRVKRAPREGADVWASRIKRWKDSGMSAQAFATELGVSAITLLNWKGKLQRLARKGGEPTRAKRAPKAAQQTAGSGFELVIGNGMTLRVAQDFDEAALSRLVRVLGGR